jgi:RNA polymerase sigma factor (sigma-70 family)
MPDPRPESAADLANLHRRYYSALMAFFVRRVGNRTEAEDLTQEVFTRLAAAEGRQVLDPDAYVFQTAANLLRDRGRRQKVRADYVAAMQPRDLSDADALSPERVVAGREGLDRVIEALQELPERTRAIFILHRLEKLTKGEIAEMFSLSVSGIDKHLVKAITHLHTRLKDVP